MSYIEEDEMDDEILVERVVLDEGRERRLAQETVSFALMSATPKLENREVKHRMLPGLWYAAVNVLLATLDVDDIVALLNDRIRVVQGSAENADAPPRTFGEAAMSQYVEEVVSAGETILEALEEAQRELEKENIEDRFPETVFDTALRVLVPSWGPDHVRRAISEQASQFFQGQFEPVNFMEPSKILDPAAARRRAAEASAARDHAPPPARPSAPEPAAVAVPSPFEFRAREHRNRRIRVFAASDVVDGVGVWSFAMTVTDDNGRYEFRKAAGRQPDPTGSRIAVAALHEAMLAASAFDRSSLLVETTDEFMVRALTARTEATVRRTEDADSWKEIDHVADMHDTTTRLVAAALSDPLQESCDHMIRDMARTRGGPR